ncbi:PAS-domain containing protein [Kiloniella sp.]|uniref:PAS-domain containing protein n=1 Tax=Kiloniella sp. TaxID=1938587 RepID=UPI003B014653
MTKNSPAQNLVTQLRFLFVGNDPDCANDFKAALERSGSALEHLKKCSLEIADNGSTAFSLCTENDYDLVIIDCHLPDMSGSVIARTLLVKTPECPLLMTARKGYEHLAFDALSHEVTDYLIRDESQSYLLHAPILISKLLTRASNKLRRIKAVKAKLKARKAVPKNIKTNVSEQDSEQSKGRKTPSMGRKELAARSKLFELSLNSINQGFIVWDKEERMVVCNNRFCELFDIPQAAIKPGTEMIEIIRYLAESGLYGKGNPEDLAQKRYFEIVTEGIVPEQQQTTNNGRILHVLQHEAAGLGRITTFTDITDIRKGERTAALLQEAMETFSDSIILYDQDEKVIFTNARYHEVYPYSPPKDEIVGYLMKDILRRTLDVGQVDHPLAKKDPDAWLAMRLAERRENIETQGEIHHASGLSYFYKTRKSTNGGHIHVQTDITERKQDEEKLLRREEQLIIQIEELRTKDERMEVQAAELVYLAEDLSVTHSELERLIEQKDKFFSIIAHDLKGPFNALLGFSRLISDKETNLTPDKVIEYGTYVHESAEQVYKLLENLLEWSLLQMGRMEFVPGTVDLDEIVLTNISLFKPVAAKKFIHLHSTHLSPSTDDKAGPRSLVRADVHMIDTIVRNLINNAIKFTPEKGEVTVSIRPGDNEVELEVADTGIGISDKVAASLFRLDVNTSNLGTSGETGTGLGLHLCKDLIERQGGKIQVASIEGQGSKFTITLPRYRKEE